MANVITVKTNKSLIGDRYYRYDLNGSVTATKVVYADGSFIQTAEKESQYYYHSDHLGSAQLVTDWRGQEYERFEYTPYGEVWVEKASAVSVLDVPYRFTGKERDKETGLYYYGARYLDPRDSRWLSVDPAMGEYVPGPGQEAGKLPGMGGVFNTVNLHVYHYAGNNPVKLVDPDGNSDLPSFDIARYYENQIMRGLSLPGIALVNMVNSIKNFFSNIGQEDSKICFQLSARLAKSAINISLNISGNGMAINIDPNILSQIEAVADSPIRTKYDKKGNLAGVDFHIPVGDIAGIGKLSAILGTNFATESGDATGVIGAKLSGLGISGATSVQLKLLVKASTIGDNPTIQGGNFVNNFKDTASRERFNQIWTDPF